MNWNQLQYILTTAEEGCITHAADRLFLSQPSLSRSIQTLEKELGTPLFQRKQGQLIPTYAGELFCQWARETLRSHQQMQRKVSEIANQQRYLIRLGISPHRSHLFLPTILREFYRQHPDCELHVLEKPTYELKERLEQGELELLIDLPHSDTVNYRNELLVEERIMLAVPRSFLPGISGELLCGDTLPLHALFGMPFVLMSPEHVIGRVCQQMCQAASFQPDVRLYGSSLEGILNLTREQLGVTFVPEIIGAEKRFGEEVRYFYVEGSHSTRQICMVYPASLFINRPLSSLMELFRQTVPGMYHSAK